ncbi:MAG: cytochrome C [Rhodospirillales bacterium]|nr:MAG: cytochrome C [Rhodospirillales bacterium]
MLINRRRALTLLGAAGAGAALASWGGPRVAKAAAPHVVVIGGGFGGATAAKYIKRRNPDIAVTLIEPAERFYTCPFSNLYLGELREFESIGHGYDELRDTYGVTVLHTWADGVDPDAKSVRTRNGEDIAYDKLVLSPGVDMQWGAIEGYDEGAADKAPHAWKAGPQTRLLKSQLEAMEDGGLFILAAPANPYRCPPGPYERVAMVAHYLKTHKPRSKILLLDAKDSFSKQALFIDGWESQYGDMIEWVSLSNDGKVVRVDADTLEVETEFGTRHKADVLNVVPPQKAGFIAERAGVTDESGWVPVKPATFESALVDDIYVVGDATVAAPMPKSGFCANTQAKVVAAAIVATLEGREPPAPSWSNTCYSLIAPGYGISVAGIYHVVDGKIAEVEGSGGVSPREAPDAFRTREARYGAAWYAAISNDTWGTAGK